MAGPKLVKKGADGGRVVVKEIVPITAPIIKLEPAKADFVSEANGADVEFGSLKLEVRGLSALADNLLRIGPNAMNAAGFEMQNILAEVINHAQIIVPVRFENLKKSGNHDMYVQNSALVKSPTILEMKAWFGAPPSETGSGNAGYSFVQTTDLEGSLIESGRKIGKQNTGMVKLKGNQAQEAGAVGENTVDPSEYALRQHEEIGFHHPLGGQPKYLETPFIAIEPTVLKRIADAVAAVLGVRPATYNVTLAGALTGG